MRRMLAGTTALTFAVLQSGVAQAMTSPADDPFAGLVAMSDRELDTLRGGLDLGPYKASIGIEITTTYNNTVQVQTSLYPTQEGGMASLETTITSLVDSALADGKAGNPIDIGVQTATVPATAVPVVAEATLSDPAVSMPSSPVTMVDTFSAPPTLPATETTSPAPIQAADASTASVPNGNVVVIDAPLPLTAGDAPVTQVSNSTTPQLPSADGTPQTTGSNAVSLQTQPQTGTSGAAAASQTANPSVQPVLTQVQTIGDNTGSEIVFSQADTPGFTRVVHEAVSGHLSLIENTTDGVDITHLVSLNLHLLNFNAVQSMMHAGLIADSLRSAFIDGALR